MSVKELSKDQLEETSMIDLATMILEDEREAIDFNELFNRIAKLKGFNEKTKEAYISQFYTDMNVDGSFMTIGTNRWGLKKWYPVEQMEEEIASLPQKRKKKKKKKPSKLVDEEVGISDYDDDPEDEDLEDDLDLTDEDLDLDDEDDDFDGDYEDDDLDEEEEEIVENDISFVGDEDEEDNQ